MKKWIVVLLFGCFIWVNTPTYAEQILYETKIVPVKGHYRSNGTYVAPYVRRIKVKKQNPKPTLKQKTPSTHQSMPNYDFDYNDHYKEYETKQINREIPATHNNR